MAYITIASFRLRHPRAVNIAAAGTAVTEADFAEWLVWATSEVNRYAKRTTNFTAGTRAHAVGTAAVDALLMKKWIFEMNIDRVDPLSIVQLKLPSIHDDDMLPHRHDLEAIRDGEQPDDEPSWTREMNLGYGGAMY